MAFGYPRLLPNTYVKVKVVAETTGSISASSFRVAFKRSIGLSPK